MLLSLKKVIKIFLSNFYSFTLFVDYPNINERSYRVLCRNGTLATHTGFNVDDNCALTVITNSEVVSRRNDFKNKDLSVALMEFENKFNIYTPFELFKAFNGTKDLLFPVSLSKN